MPTNNSEHNITSVEDFPDIPLGNFIGISVGVFGATGVLINSLVLVVVLIAQRSRFTAYKYLMCHLALADLLCSIMLGPYVPLELAEHNWIYPNEDVCQLIYPLISCFTNVATGTILLISIERYRGIIYPHSTPWQPRDMRIAFCMVWLGSVSLVIPNSIKLKVIEFKNIDYCNEYWENQTHRKVYGFSYFAFAFAIPLLLITIMHIIIMVRLKSPELRPDNISASQERQNKRITRVLTGIIIVFFICVCPNKILHFVWDIDAELEKSRTSKARFYMRTFQVLYYARVAIDPLIYCFFDTRFNKDLKKAGLILRGKRAINDALRSRSASQRTSTILSVRSRANSSFIGDTPEMNGALRYVQPAMDCITEVSTDYNREQKGHQNLGFNDTTSSLGKNTPDDNHGNGCLQNGFPLEKRIRSDTVDTDVSSQQGSSSPLVHPLFASKI